MFFIVLSFSIQLVLDIIQIKYLNNNKKKVPEQFREMISLQVHQKSIQYSVAKLKHRIKRNIVEIIIIFSLTTGGFLDYILKTFYNFESNFNIGSDSSAVLMILLFFGALFLIDLPFTLYKQFVIEERFGFNKMTINLFISDTIKSTLLSLLLFVPLLFAMFNLIDDRLIIGEFWWVILWIVTFLLSLTFMVCYPTFIAPMFNKFTSLPNSSLKTRLEDLLERCKFEAKGLYTMDGSKRSSHGNAYFAGLGRGKRIVLFDTLINKLSEKEIEAVLAHEVGHYKCGHIPTRLISSSIFLFAFFWVFSLSIDSSLFYISMGITLETLDTLGDNTVTYGAFLILFFYVLPFLLFPLKPLNSILSRKHEFEADRYAAKTSEPKNLISALIKLYRENSAPVITNRWFSLFYDSHPNAKARIEALE